MKIIRDGDALFTTPILVGYGDSVLKAAKCEHDWLDIGDPVEAKSPMGGPSSKAPMIQSQRCSKCVATRLKLSPKAGDTIDELGIAY